MSAANEFYRRHYDGGVEPGTTALDEYARQQLAPGKRYSLVSEYLAKTRRPLLGTARRRHPHWTGRAMANSAGISLRAVQRLWEKHRLQPHRIRTFKRSNDANFAAGPCF